MRFINLPDYQKEDITGEIVKDFLNSLAKDGKTIEIVWNGGNDEGEIYLTIENHCIYYQYLDSPYYSPAYDPNHGLMSRAEQFVINYIIDAACDVLDYGSWAGEFNASGTATYVYNEHLESWCFEGEDESNIEDSNMITIGTDVTIPFDYVYSGVTKLYIDIASDESNSFHVSMGYGLETEDCLNDEAKKKLREELNLLERTFTEIIDEKLNDQWEEDYSSVYYSNIFNLKEMMLDSENIDPLKGILIDIDSVSVYGYNSEFRDITVLI
jgi:hypothetical protein